MPHLLPRWRGGIELPARTERAGTDRQRRIVRRPTRAQQACGVRSLWSSSEALTAASVNHMNTIHAAIAAAKIVRKRNACIFDFHRIPALTRCQRRGMLPPRPDAIGFNRMDALSARSRSRSIARWG